MSSAYHIHVAGKLRASARWLLLLCLGAGLCSCGSGSRQVAETGSAPDATAVPTATPVPAIVPTFTPTPIIRVANIVPPGRPTPLPSPQTYTALPGDTLIGIAHRFGTTAAALQAINRIEDPRTLQIGQQLLIPFGTPGSSAPTPRPLPHDVMGVTSFVDGLGYPWIMGTVANRAQVPMEQVRVQALLLDGENSEIERGQILALRYVTPPGEAAPFMLRLTAAEDTWSSWLLSVSSAQAAHAGAFHQDLEVTALSFTASARNLVRVRGQVTNTGAIPAAEPEVVVTVWNGTGQVIGIRVLYPDLPVLAPRGQAAFAGTVFIQGDPATRISAFAQGFAAPE